MPRSEGLFFNLGISSTSSEAVEEGVPVRFLGAEVRQPCETARCCVSLEVFHDL